jgi:hypothetical protein
MSADADTKPIRMPHTVYFAIVQWQPTRIRAEGANVGVVLVDPDRGRLETAYVTAFDRLRMMFPKAKLDDVRLASEIRSFDARLREVDVTVPAVGTFLIGETHNVVATPLRAADGRVATLRRLFTELVED